MKTNSSNSQQGPVFVACEDGNGHSGSIKREISRSVEWLITSAGEFDCMQFTDRSCEWSNQCLEISGATEWVGLECSNPPTEIPKFWQSRTGLQIERKMFIVPIPTS